MGKCTYWDVLTAYNKYEGSTTAHQDIIKTLNNHGHSIKKTDSWSTETLMAVLYDIDSINIIHNYSQTSKQLKKNNQDLWHKGAYGIRPGDILIYGDSKNTPNNVEFCVGYNLTIAGNHNNKCDRRTYMGRNVLGYLRPSYNIMPAMNELQITICAAEVMLGTYGSGENREEMLAVFGTSNAKKIQDKVNIIAKKEEDIIFALAVSSIAGYCGKNDYRKQRLKKYATKVQNKINEIYNLKGQTTMAAAQCVINGKFGKEQVRTLLLSFCKYNPTTIQNQVNILLRKNQQTDNRIRLIQLWISETHEDYYGDSYLILEYQNDNKTIKNSVLIDTGPLNGDTLKKMQKYIPLKQRETKPKLNAIFLSHGHGDHVDGLEKICKSFNVENIFISDYKEMQSVKNASAAVNKLKKAGTIAKKYGAVYKYISNDFSWNVGKIKCEWSWQVKKSKLKQFDDHHFVNMMSIVLMFDLNGWKFLTGGDLSYEAIDALVTQKKDKVKCDIFKIFWHSDRNGIKIALAKLCKMLVALSNYHHSTSNGGRQSTYKIFTDLGAIVMKAYENGDCYLDCYPNRMEISCSKKNLSKIFYK